MEEKIKIQLNQEKIDSINNKVLASVDEKLAEGKAQLDLSLIHILEDLKSLEYVDRVEFIAME